MAKKSFGWPANRRQASPFSSFFVLFTSSFQSVCIIHGRKQVRIEIKPRFSCATNRVALVWTFSENSCSKLAWKKNLICNELLFHTRADLCLNYELVRRRSQSNFFYGLWLGSWKAEILKKSCFPIVIQRFSCFLFFFFCFHSCHLFYHFEILASHKPLVQPFISYTLFAVSYRFFSPFHNKTLFMEHSFFLSHSISLSLARSPLIEWKIRFYLLHEIISKGNN